MHVLICLISCTAYKYTHVFELRRAINPEIFGSSEAFLPLIF